MTLTSSGCRIGVEVRLASIEDAFYLGPQYGGVVFRVQGRCKLHDLGGERGGPRDHVCHGGDKASMGRDGIGEPDPDRGEQVSHTGPGGPQSLAQGSDSPVRGKVGVAPLPASGDGQSSAALGGWQLAVSRYSTNPEAAASLALYLTGAAEQKRRAIEGSFNPTRQSLYKDSEIIAANPLFAKLGPILKSVVARPSTTLGSFYSRVSAEFWQTVHTVLVGQETAEPALERLQGRLEALRRRR